MKRKANWILQQQDLREKARIMLAGRYLEKGNEGKELSYHEQDKENGRSDFGRADAGQQRVCSGG
jgi:hypothetical protein